MRPDIAAPIRTDSMNTEQTRALIRDFYDTLARGDREHLAILFTDDVEWQMPASVPNGLLQGRELVLNELSGETVKRLFERGTFRLTIHAIYADGDKGIVQTGTRAKTKAGSDYAMEYVWVYTCRDQKISHIREYLDTANAFDMLGWNKS
jgi:ketosteroid isomerase-like protein